MIPMEWTSAMERIKQRKIGTRVGIGTVMVLCMAITVMGIQWKRDENMRFVRKLGVGISLGNSLDANGLWNYEPEADELEYEVFWHNPAIHRQQFRTIREAGFQTVRIPVSWGDHMDEEGDVSEVWMNRVQEVVDMALEEELYVILNSHHENWLDLIPKREQAMEQNLRILWRQIAARFEGYDGRLLFEGMNEPRQKDSEYEWNEGTEELRAMVNRLNASFVETVRERGGKNQDRYLLVTTYAGHHLEKVMEDLEVPKGHIIVSIHAYLPYHFCQNRDGTAQWSLDNIQDTEELQRAFTQMQQFFIQKGIPVIVTEFGCVDKDNIESRLAWTRYYMELAKETGIACIWWDNGSDYRLLDREGGGLVYPGLAECLTGKDLE